jgi:predicted enzyme related to lactoylglutathione lyase
MMNRWTIAPYFIVDDVVATANFYRDKLGFSYDRFWGDPPMFCMVGRNGITIMLSRQKGVHPNGADSWDAYLWIDDADSLRNEFVAKGVKIVRELCDQEYDMRDFDILDCNGYRLCFGHHIGGE